MIAAQTPIAVTGSTGRLGSRVASGLSELGVDHRLVVRDPAKAPELPGTHIAACDYGDGAAARTALTGARTVFMVSAAETPDRVQQHLTFIDAAVAAGVERIVYVSFFGASATATFTLARDHWATEEHLRSVGIAHTILRDNIYADFTPYFVGTDGIIRGRAGSCSGTGGHCRGCDCRADQRWRVRRADAEPHGTGGTHLERDRRHPQ